MSEIVNDIMDNWRKGTDANSRTLVGWLRDEIGVRENSIIPAHICEQIEFEPTNELGTYMVILLMNEPSAFTEIQ